MSTTKHRRKPYLPDSDLGKMHWMEKFVTTLELNPERFGFDDPREFEYVQRTIRTFITLAAAVNAPGKRCGTLVTEKNNARKAAVELCRGIAMRLKWDPSLSDIEKSHLGLCVEADDPRPAALPKGVLPGSLGHPSLQVISSYNGGHLIKYSDSTSPSRAKPKGVSHLLLFAAIGDAIGAATGDTHRHPSTAVPMPVSQARLLGAFTKRPFEILYPGGCGLEGRRVTYWGRWLTTRGDMSPWSMPCTRVIGDALGSWEQCPFRYIFADVEGKWRLADRPQALGPAMDGPALAGAVEGGLSERETSGRCGVNVVDERPILMSEAMEQRMAALMAEGQRMLEGAVARLDDQRRAG